MNTTQLLNILSETDNLDDILEKIPDLSFSLLLESFCERAHMTKSDLIKKTNLDRTYAYQIFNNTKNPSQDKVIQLALALSLNLHDTNLLLTLSNNKSLYPKLKRDAVIIFCINKKYSVMETNELLDEYQYPILQ